MTDIDTEELRRLTAEATPGPWHTVTTTVDLFVDTPERQVASLNREFYGQADAALIVAMRNALPGIIAALDAKDAEIERLREIENVYEQAEAKVAALEASEADRG